MYPLFLISIALAISSGTLLNSIVRHISWPGWLMGNYIFICSSLILPLLVSGLTKQFHPAGVLLAQSIFFILSILVWKKSGQPELFPKRIVQSWTLSRIPTLLWLLLVGIFFIVVVNGILSIAIPQNNFDAMSYHLARIGYWLQHQSLLPWDTPNFRQTAWPLNAELLASTSVLFLHSDRLTGLVQWFSYIFGILLVYSFSRLMDASRPAGLFAAIIWATFPLILLESSTTQNDLVVSTFFLTSVYFYLLGWKKQDFSFYIPAGFAFGLSLGTKLTAIFALPGFILVILAIARKLNLQNKFKHYLIIGTWFLIGTTLLGSYTYIQNLILYHYPFGPSELGVGSFTNLQKGSVRWKHILFNYIYQSIDFTGLPPAISNSLDLMKRNVGWKFINKLGTSSCDTLHPYAPFELLGIGSRVHEDFSWFGPISFSFLPISSVLFLIQGWRRKNFTFWALFFIATTYTLIIIFQGWTPHRHRYFILGVTALAPSLSWWYSHRKWAFIIGFLALTIAYQTTLWNESKPLIGENAIWNKSTLELRTRNNPIIYPLFQTFEKEVPPNSKVATFLGHNGYDRLFFGENFGHTVFQSDLHIESQNISWLFDNNLEYLVVISPLKFPDKSPNGLEPVYVDEIGGIYKLNLLYSSSTVAPAISKEDSYLPSIYKISDSLIPQIKVLREWIGKSDGGYAWYIEQDDNGSFAWIGQCSSQGFWSKIWADEHRNIKLQINIEPGPSRTDPFRSIIGVVSDEDSIRRWTSAPVQFKDSTEISMLVPLEPGINIVGLYILEPPDISILPNGDTRPLLARIREIKIDKP